MSDLSISSTRRNGSLLSPRGLNRATENVFTKLDQALSTVDRALGFIGSTSPKGSINSKNSMEQNLGSVEQLAAMESDNPMFRPYSLKPNVN